LNNNFGGVFVLYNSLILNQQIEINFNYLIIFDNALMIVTLKLRLKIYTYAEASVYESL